MFSYFFMYQEKWFIYVLIYVFVLLISIFNKKVSMPGIALARAWSNAQWHPWQLGHTTALDKEIIQIVLDFWF